MQYSIVSHEVGTFLLPKDLRPGASIPDIHTASQREEAERDFPPHTRDVDRIKDELQEEHPMLPGVPVDKHIADSAEADGDHGAAVHKVPTETIAVRRSPFANINVYVAVLSTMGFLITCDTMLRFAVLTTLQRRFNLQTMEAGMIISSYDIGHVLLLMIISYIGGNVHKPRWLAAGGVMVSIAGVLWALPHFLFGSGIEPIQDTGLNTSTVYTGQVCVANTTQANNTGILDCPTATNGTRNELEMQQSSISFWILFVSQCILGAGLAPYLTFGIAYIDDNTDPQSSALYVGIAYSIGTLGMVMGFLVGAVLTGVFVDLKATTLTPEDPRWIGAWWLGSLVIALAVVVFTVLMAFFPKHLPKPRRKKVLLKHDNSSPPQSPTRRLSKSKRSSLYGSIKGKSNFQPKVYSFPRAMLMLHTNVVFVTSTMGLCAMTYLAGGVFTFLPKYIETQFGQLSWVANIVTALISTGAMAGGTFFGGWFAARFRLTPPGSIKLITVTCTVGVGVLIILVFLGCPQVELAAPRDQAGVPFLDTACNIGCGCNLGVDPVCGSDGRTHYSPCYAGCATTNGANNFTDCDCVDVAGNSSSGGTVTAGWCPLQCVTLIPYAIIFFIVTFSSTTGMAPILAITLRCVEPELKPLALSINNILTSVIASIPAPMLYGILIDSTCVFWESRCSGEQYCLLYDMARFRQLFHGVTIVVLALGLCCFIIAWLKLRTMRFTEEGEMITDYTHSENHDHNSKIPANS